MSVEQGNSQSYSSPQRGPAERQPLQSRNCSPSSVARYSCNPHHLLKRIVTEKISTAVRGKGLVITVGEKLGNIARHFTDVSNCPQGNVHGRYNPPATRIRDTLDAVPSLHLLLLGLVSAFVIHSLATGSTYLSARPVGIECLVPWTRNPSHNGTMSVQFSSNT